MLSKKAIDEFKVIYKEESGGKKLTDAEAADAANRLLGFMEVLMKAAAREEGRKKRLKKESKGFHLEEDGSVYNCLVCHRQISGKTGWWDEWGQKCLDCQRSINEGVIPPQVCTDSDSWFADWELKGRFGVHPQTIKKMRRLGELKARELQDRDGGVYFRVYLISENQDFLKARLQVRELD